ncbi:unnamed protein product [[Candida] boidinii]|nr:unnamed protein product [[Candida] boidinii]
MFCFVVVEPFDEIVEVDFAFGCIGDAVAEFKPPWIGGFAAVAPAAPAAPVAVVVFDGVLVVALGWVWGWVCGEVIDVLNLLLLNFIESEFDFLICCGNGGSVFVFVFVDGVEEEEDDDF